MVHFLADIVDQLVLDDLGPENRICREGDFIGHFEDTHDRAPTKQQPVSYEPFDIIEAAGLIDATHNLVVPCSIMERDISKWASVGGLEGGANTTTGPNNEHAQQQQYGFHSTRYTDNDNTARKNVMAWHGLTSRIERRFLRVVHGDPYATSATHALITVLGLMPYPLGLVGMVLFHLTGSPSPWLVASTGTCVWYWIREYRQTKLRPKGKWIVEGLLPRSLAQRYDTWMDVLAPTLALAVLYGWLL